MEASALTPDLARIMGDADRNEVGDELSGALAHRTRQTS